jgi:hypothetical protein
MTKHLLIPRSQLLHRIQTFITILGFYTDIKKCEFCAKTVILKSVSA